MENKTTRISLWVAVTLLATVFCSSCISKEKETKEGKKTNVIIINTDDLGYGDLSCYGATHVSTPDIDKLAGQGRMFTDAHSASAVCTPSRYALLTGEYPFRHRAYKTYFP